MSTDVTAKLSAHETTSENRKMDHLREMATIDQASRNSSSGANAKNHAEVPTNDHFLLSIHRGIVLFMGLGLLVVVIRNRK